MRLIRFGPPDHELPGVLLASGARKDLSGVFHDWDVRFFRENGIPRLSQYATIENLRTAPDVPLSARWAAPIGRPGKVVCVGLNPARQRESRMQYASTEAKSGRHADRVCGGIASGERRRLVR